MTAIICDSFDQEQASVKVPAMTLPDGRADLVAIRRHLREQGYQPDNLKVNSI